MIKCQANFNKRGSWTSLKFLFEVFVNMIKSFWSKVPGQDNCRCYSGACELGKNH
jgi:hypothetical protein